MSETAEEARRRSVERMRQQVANGHAPQAQRSNGHAPAADQINWAQVIAGSELRHERQILALKEQMELVAKPAQGEATSLSDELIDALAKGSARTIATVVKPLREQIAKLEQRPRLEGVRTLKAEWICEEPNTNNGLSCEECGSRGPRMRPGPTLLTSSWLAIAKRPEEFLCGVCVLQRCRDRLGRELKSSDLRATDNNRSWLAALAGSRHG